jgi:phenylacetate-CoA ligase
MTLACEVDAVHEGLREAIAASIRSVCNLRGEVALQQPGTLPNDGKVIDDGRSYE